MVEWLIYDIYVEGVVLEVEALEVDFDKVSTPETMSPILAAATDKGKSKATVEEGGISMDEDGTATVVMSQMLTTNSRI